MSVINVIINDRINGAIIFQVVVIQGSSTLDIYVDDYHSEEYFVFKGIVQPRDVFLDTQS